MGNIANKAALFDFDGVVVDTESQYSIFWNEMGRIFRPEIKEFGNIIKGQTLTQIYNQHFNNQLEVQQKITSLLNEFERNMNYDYIPGVYEFMEELRDNGVKIAIVTSSNNIKMENAYKAHPELKEITDKIITADMLTHSKPNPECFLLGAKLFNASPDNCIVFEDSFHGLQAGRSAGMKVVGLATTNTRESIIDKADMVIDNFIGLSIKNII